MNNSIKYWLYFFMGALIIGFGFSSCVMEDDFVSDQSVNLKFSSDTLRFDTVFTTMGSVTKQIKVYNKESKPIKIDRISLGGGVNSFYRLNVDGDTSMVLRDVEIGAKDSMFIFARVTIDPNNQNNPLLVSDSIIFSFNNKEQYVQLEAYGQDAYYHVPNAWLVFENADKSKDSIHYSLAHFGDMQRGVILNGNDIEWRNDKPHIIFGILVVNPTTSLNITEGTRIHLNKNADIWVLSNASLKVNGSYQNNVIFQGMRKDNYYSNLAGQWGTIRLMMGSKNNRIDNAIIKNGTIGIVVDSCVTSNIPTLEINNSRIENMSHYGLLSRGGHINASNTIVQNTGAETVALIMGGKYNFVYCTFANYWAYDSRRTSKTLFLQNYYISGKNNIVLRPIEECNFYNTIIYGANEEEIEIDKSELATLNYYFENCLLATKTINSNSTSVRDSYFNLNPLFNEPNEGDLRIKENSPAIGRGNSTWNSIYPYDIIGNSRSNPPSIGAYEYSLISSPRRKR